MGLWWISTLIFITIYTFLEILLWVMTKFSSSFRWLNGFVGRDDSQDLRQTLNESNHAKNVLENIKKIIYLWFYENWNRSHRSFSPISPGGWRWVSNRRPPPLNSLLGPTSLPVKLWPPHLLLALPFLILAGSDGQIDVWVCPNVFGERARSW